MKLFTKLFCYAGYILFRPIWWLERLLPRSKKIWIFGAWYGQKYSDNSKWLYEYVLEHEPAIKAVWITKNRSVYEKLCAQKKSVCMSTSLSGAWCCLRAGYAFFSSTQEDVNKFFINGVRQIWLWHGMPLKKIGYDDNLVAVSEWKQRLADFLAPYTVVRPYCTCTSADFFIPFLKTAFRLKEERIWKTGLPRCDVFFSGKKSLFVRKVQKQFSNARVFLYLPTFRMSSRMDGTPFSPFQAEFGFEEQEFIQFLQKENIIMLYKPHFVDSAVDVAIHSDRFRFIKENEFEDLYVLLNSVDALITDYSSVYFDFLASRKPIFLLPFDYVEYTRNSRGHYFDMYRELHGAVCNSWSDFYSSVVKIKTVDLETDRTKFAEYMEGMSCKKIVMRITGE